LRGKQNSGKDDELVAAKLTDGISVEFDGAGENSVDRDDDALRTRFSHRLLQVLHRLRVNATTARYHYTPQQHRDS